MLAEQDIKTLQEAGILDTDRLLSSLAALIRSKNFPSMKMIPNAMTTQEEEFLVAGGAKGVGNSDGVPALENVAMIASEYDELERSSYTQNEVANLLNVTTSRVRQRLDNGTLYWINGSNGRVCPRFQFFDNRTLPGLAIVLASLSKSAHPLVVNRFFLTEQVDLESELLGRRLTPRDWLATRHDPKEVVILARDL